MRTSKRTRVIGAILVLMSLLMVTCDDFSLSETFYRDSDDAQTDDPGSGDPDTGLPLAIFPATAATWTSGSLEFVGQGGVPAYSFSVEGTEAGSIDAETGVYTAPPVAGEFTVTVTDQAGDSRPGVVYVVEEDPLRISPRSASVAVGEMKEFVASGGEGGYVYSTDPAGVGTVDAATGAFTAGTIPGSTNVKVTDGINTIAAAVLVYEGVPGELQLIIDEPEIEQGDSTVLRVIEGTPTTEISLLGQDLDLTIPDGLGFASGLGHPDWTGQYVAGDSIGIIEISATDTGPPEETGSVVVTVLPATPTNLVANNDTGSPSSIRLTWDHSAPLPPDGGFKIYRSSSSAPVMTAIGTTGPDVREYLDNGVSPSVSYYVYEIEAFTPTPDFTSRRSEPSAPTTSKP